MADYPYTETLRANLHLSFCHFEKVVIETHDLREASVAVVVVGMSDGCAGVLLTLRTSKLGRHAGQFALPGGKVDLGESQECAARRELKEELGLSLAPMALLGQLDDYRTRSGFLIHPYVYWGGDQPKLVLNDDEVAEVYCVPLSELDSEAIPLFEVGVDEHRPVLFSQLPSIKTAMYAPTAALLYQFREVALRGLHTRVAHYDQPVFAWH